STVPASVTSPVSVIAWPPALLISATVSWAVASDASGTAMRAPSRANASAVARPMPPPPPVIRADLPSNSPAISTSSGGFFPCPRNKANITGRTMDNRAMREEILAYKRDRILEEAVKLFYERGFTGTTLDDIAAELGVTKPFIYTHFRSKTDLL